MPGRFIVALVILTLADVSSSFAQRGNGAAAAGGRPVFSGDRLRRENDGFIYDNQPQIVVVEDPAAAEARREKAENNQADKREKAVEANGDPMGGFFTEEQSPKNIFSR